MSWDPSSESPEAAPVSNVIIIITFWSFIDSFTDSFLRVAKTAEELQAAVKGLKL